MRIKRPIAHMRICEMRVETNIKQQLSYLHQECLWHRLTSALRQVVTTISRWTGRCRRKRAGSGFLYSTVQYSTELLREALYTVLHTLKISYFSLRKVRILRTYTYSLEFSEGGNEVNWVKHVLLRLNLYLSWLTEGRLRLTRFHWGYKES